MLRDYSQERYLASKRTVDDRALNGDVLDALQPTLRSATRVVEVGAGIGTMLQRLVEWDRLPVDDVTYTLVDVDEESLAAAAARLPAWAAERGYDVAVESTDGVENVAFDVDDVNDEDVALGVDDEVDEVDVNDEVDVRDRIRIETRDGTLHVRTVVADATTFLADAEPDLVIGCAFLDLLRSPAVDDLFDRLPAGCVCYFPITFDGGTIIEPPTDPGFDEHVVERYHEDMRNRREPGDPHAGRRLLTRATRDHDLIAAGAADWVVASGLDGAPADAYPADEAYFLRHIVETIRGALADDPAVDDARLADWVADRRAAIDEGRLVYVAHQLDVLLRVDRS